MSRRDDAPRDLLFGLLALQNGLVTRDQLVAAFGVWTAAPTRSLADLLGEQAALNLARRALLDAFVTEHLALHEGDPEKSLAGLAIGRSTRDSLRAAAGPDAEPSLGLVGTDPGSTEHEETLTYSVGSSTSDGQRFRVLRPHARGGGDRVRGARHRAAPRGRPEADP